MNVDTVGVVYLETKGRANYCNCSKHSSYLNTQNVEEMYLSNSSINCISSDPGYGSKDLSFSLTVQFPELSLTDIKPRHAQFDEQRSRQELSEKFYALDEDKDNQLILCIINEMQEEALFIILCSVSPEQLNSKNNSGFTALMYAVACKQKNIIRRLLSYGASLAIIDNNGDTALHIACRLGLLDSVKELLRPLNASETRLCHYKVIDQSIPQDLNMINCEGETCLHLVTKYFLKTGEQDALEIITLLVMHGADINAKERKSGKTILHLATENDCMHLVNHIISMRYVNFDEEAYDQRTAVDIAHLCHHSDIEDKLVRFGARPYIEHSDDMWDEGYFEEIDAI